MSLLRSLFLLILIVSLTACQLYFIDRDDDDDDDRSGGTATLTLRIQGTEEAGFREIGLRIHGVELQGEDRTESFDIAERTVLLYEGGGVLLNGVEVRAQRYNRVRLRLANPERTGRALSAVAPTVPHRLLDRFTRLVDGLLDPGER